MPRFALLALTFALPFTVQAAESLKDHELNQMLRKVATESSQGTPRAINEDILDRGYTVQGKQLINNLSVRPAHAARMRENPAMVRVQLAESVCQNNGYRQLLARGATLVYDFTEYQTNKPVMVERFQAADCGLGK